MDIEGIAHLENKFEGATGTSPGVASDRKVSGSTFRATL